jgi:hypothetical protein
LELQRGREARKREEANFKPQTSNLKGERQAANLKLET